MLESLRKCAAKFAAFQILLEVILDGHIHTFLNIRNTQESASIDERHENYGKCFRQGMAF